MSRILSARRIVVAALLALAASGAALASRPVVPEPLAHAWVRAQGGGYLGRGGVALQAGRWDCGVAVLEMALANGGRRPVLEEPRLRVEARRGGLSLLEMQEIAAAHGAASTGWHLGFDDLSRAPLPLVAHYRDHFVVVDRVRRDGTVELRDPALGRMRLPRRAFDRRWTGNVLLFGEMEGGADERRNGGR